MFFLVQHDRQTFVIDLEPNRVKGGVYVLDQTFDLGRQLHPLSWLEATIPQVSGATYTTISFEIASSPCESGGASICATRFCEITEPLPKKKQGDVGDEEDARDDIGENAEIDIGDDDASSQCEVDAVVDSNALFAL